MGCYDSFRLPKPLMCPICKVADDSLGEFQTKEFGGWLRIFLLGKEVIFNGCLYLKDGKYPVYTFCDSCDAWIDANAVIEGGKFVRIEDIKAMTQKERWNNIGVGEY